MYKPDPLKKARAYDKNSLALILSHFRLFTLDWPYSKIAKRLHCSKSFAWRVLHSRCKPSLSILREMAFVMAASRYCYECETRKKWNTPEQQRGGKVGNLVNDF